MTRQGNPLRTFFYNISLDTFVLDEDPPRHIRPLIENRATRRE